MQIARVCGTVVSTQKEPSLQGVKFLLVQFIDEQGQSLPEYEVAADSVGAGVGEWVLVSRGSAARQAPGSESRPLDALVIGIIDTVSVENRPFYSKREQDLQGL
jgi:carbon dioxide concentrating mechanism protein CcmL